MLVTRASYCQLNHKKDHQLLTVISKDSSDNIIDGVKNASGLVSKPLVEEGNDKLMNNQESSAALSVDSSSPNSLEGNWGSVSVLSTASIDTETLHGGDKSKVNTEKSTAETSDVYEPPSFMTLVQPEGTICLTGFVRNYEEMKNERLPKCLSAQEKQT